MEVLLACTEDEVPLVGSHVCTIGTFSTSVVAVVVVAEVEEVGLIPIEFPWLPFETGSALLPVDEETMGDGERCLWWYRGYGCGPVVIR